ncbi:eCIS core domain-containing protein [Flavobacterium chungangense]|uniref:eCIS core domain-containing protein n=1 Tax=Flavobacterium chungangense TaxID=554283 RepID=A0A6V6Z7C4_9FLAO|nr:DUF4157 domain-containing protein [Flavobacterium chungangense]CAD0007529.1 hypothetical protein FLACHUCJ7_03358 [Flavobacterium chungangense]
MEYINNKATQQRIESVANSITSKTVQNKTIKLQDNRPASVLQRKNNNTGLPDNLKSGIENLSGHSMDDVKVHYNSDKPAALNAHAFAQGTDIHIASGQEKHLPHEAWHVVQQKQGRVKPTLQMKGKVNVNDDKGLEREADVMGTKAITVQKKEVQNLQINYTKPNNVTQLNREYGLNTKKHIGEFTDSLHENLAGKDLAPPMVKLSAMMVSINNQLRILKFPELEIISKKGLGNKGSAHFDFRTWKMEIDESLLTIDANLANTLYHEARHSEQWFKMILMRIKKHESKEKIVSEMSVPLKIVEYALQLNAETVLPKEQHKSVAEFHESVYGSGREERNKVLTNLNVKGNYQKYKNLPEEVDAWEVGGKVNIAIEKKENDLIKTIMQSEQIDTIRASMSQLQFYSKMLNGNDNKAKEVLVNKLNLWKEEIEKLRSLHSDKTGENLQKYITISTDYNKLCTMVGLEKILQVDMPKVLKDFEIMDNNLKLAKEKQKIQPKNWVLAKLIEYIEASMAQYNSEVIRPKPNSANWAVWSTGQMLNDMDQAILEANEDALN